MYVHLNYAECNAAKLIAEEVLGWHSKRGNLTSEFWREDKVDNQIQSVGAELAVAKYLNVYPPLAVVANPLKYDLVYNGLCLDVKSTEPPPPTKHLLIPYLKQEVIYISVWADMPHFQINGFAIGLLVPSLGEWVELPKHSCWRIAVNKLTDIEELKNGT